VVEASAGQGNDGLWPPASKPEAMIISTPLASKQLPHPNVVAAPAVTMPNLWQLFHNIGRQGAKHKAEHFWADVKDHLQLVFNRDLNGAGFCATGYRARQIKALNN